VPQKSTLSKPSKKPSSVQRSKRRQTAASRKKVSPRERRARCDQPCRVT
jgi:hypothetical protein